MAVELHEALAQITEIRAQIDRTETFRGYRSVTVAFTGALAIAAGVVQAVLIPDPQQQLAAYLTLWIAAAVLSLIVTGTEMAVRCFRAASPWTVRLTWMAVEQFLPCLFAGALVTVVLTTMAEESVWMLPGLWAIIFGLGVFASCRLLPRPIFWIGAFYLFAGAYVLAVSCGEFALSPWTMAVPFGAGQLATAAILYWKLERRHEQS